MLQQKTTHLRKEDVKKVWIEVDATDKVVGRLATQIADRLRGKHRPTFSPHLDTGDYVVVKNCEKVQFKGQKWQDKQYFWHSNHIGGIKSRSAEEMLERSPERILYLAVKRMLPKSSLGRKQLTKLRIFKGEEHPHQGQQPTPVELNA